MTKSVDGSVTDAMASVSLGVDNTLAGVKVVAPSPPWGLGSLLWSCHIEVVTKLTLWVSITEQ